MPTQGESESSNIIGSIYRNAAKDSLALVFYNKGLQIALSINNERTASGAYGSIAMLHMDRKEYKQAREYLEKAMNIYHKLNNKQNLGYIILSLGRLDLLENNCRKCRFHSKNTKRQRI